VAFSRSLHAELFPASDRLYMRGKIAHDPSEQAIPTRPYSGHVMPFDSARIHANRFYALTEQPLPFKTSELEFLMADSEAFRILVGV